MGMVRDEIRGGNGKDVLMGGDGADELYGGFGMNTFAMSFDGEIDKIFSSQMSTPTTGCMRAMAIRTGP